MLGREENHAPAIKALGLLTNMRLLVDVHLLTRLYGISLHDYHIANKKTTIGKELVHTRAPACPHSSLVRPGQNMSSQPLPPSKQ